MSAATPLRVGHVLTCRRRSCRVAVVATVVALVVYTTVAPRLTTTPRQRPSSRVTDVDTGDVTPDDRPTRPNDSLAPPGGYTELTSGGATVQHAQDRITEGPPRSIDNTIVQNAEERTTVAPSGGRDEPTSTGGATVRRSGDRVTCKRWPPMDDGEEAARKFFFSTQKANCSHQRRHELCRIEVRDDIFVGDTISGRGGTVVGSVARNQFRNKSPTCLILVSFVYPTLH